ncbi:hypothetical protein BpHYR1_054588 [Brachionus plicatilis]|uniref:Uncharacterized protein n=1 Tax=Brachionus plicatilis TaxID=10195 RepID=A0A3M7RAE0_BRAPC|nr:hypothetical protein BpHYR1_054588 [Brachionus plicatilis]
MDLFKFNVRKLSFMLTYIQKEKKFNKEQFPHRKTEKYKIKVQFIQEDIASQQKNKKFSSKQAVTILKHLIKMLIRIRINIEFFYPGKNKIICLNFFFNI